MRRCIGCGGNPLNLEVGDKTGSAVIRSIGEGKGPRTNSNAMGPSDTYLSIPDAMPCQAASWDTYCVGMEIWVHTLLRQLDLSDIVWGS